MSSLHKTKPPSKSLTSAQKKETTNQEGAKTSAGKIEGCQTISKPSNNNPKIFGNNNYTHNRRNQGTDWPFFATCGKTNYSTKRNFFGTNAAKSQTPRNKNPAGLNQVLQREIQKNSNMQAAADA